MSKKIDVSVLWQSTEFCWVRRNQIASLGQSYRRCQFSIHTSFLCLQRPFLSSSSLLFLFSPLFVLQITFNRMAIIIENWMKKVRFVCHWWIQVCSIFMKWVFTENRKHFVHLYFLKEYECEFHRGNKWFTCDSFLHDLMYHGWNALIKWLEKDMKLWSYPGPEKVFPYSKFITMVGPLGNPE